MFDFNIGTILLFSTFFLIILDAVLILMSKKIKQWLFYDHIILYLATVTYFGAFIQFLLNLIFQDSSYSYVTSYSSAQMDIPLRIASSWSGAVGSFYLWTTFMVSGYIIFRFLFRRLIDQEIYRYASFIQSANIVAFLIFIIIKDPFARNATIPTNGTGLNPLLATFLNLIHPPIIFLGYSIFVIPFSLALAKIITRLTDNEAPAELQKFLRLTMALAWMILGIGILIGGYWAYTTLGWGGFWGWDPVETGSLIPWLFGLVYFHGSPVFKSDKGNFGKDVIATFPFISIIFATIVTRTGALTSVHSFSEGPGDNLLILYIFLVLVIVGFFIYQLYQHDKIRFFYSIDELLHIKRQDAALYISFFAFFLGTLAIMFGQVVPFIFASLPEPYTTTFTVSTRFFNIIIGVFGFAALEAAFFTDFVFIKAEQNKLIVIGIGVWLGIINVILNLPVVDFYLNRANIGFLYSLLHILGTTSLLANFMLPILVLTVPILLITIYKFITSKEMQKQIKMRKISQTLLHLGIVIALIGALVSYNSTQTNEVLLTPNSSTQSGYITTAQDMNMTILSTNYTPFGLNFVNRLQAYVQLEDNNGHVIGQGMLEYTNYTDFGLIVNVLIISSLTNDFYITIMTYTANSNSLGISNIRFQIRIIPMITLLWLGAILVEIAMLSLVVVALRLFIYSYKNTHKHISMNKNNLNYKTQLTV